MCPRKDHVPGEIPKFRARFFHPLGIYQVPRGRKEACGQVIPPV
jgi:hypothetical protein